MAKTATEPAISVQNTSKIFKLPHERASSVKTLVLNFYRHHRSFENQKALQDISFEIKKGEFFGIVGRNGSGKSTLLKLLAGIYSPTKGRIHVNGKLTPFIELGVGFNPELTGRDNIFLNGALLGFTRKEMLAMYDDIVEFAELERFMDQKLKNYSSGMQVRLAFSIAIRAKSDILLIDEVLAVGDVMFQKKCFEYFSELKKSGVTVVFVSHDSDALLRFCDRGLLIDQGKVQTVGPIKKVVDEYREALMQYKEEADAHTGEHVRKEGSQQKHKLVTIKKCRMVDREGKSKKRFTSGETVAIELELNIDSSVKPPLNIAIGVYNGLYEANSSSCVFGASTQLDGSIMPVGATKARLILDKPPLKNEEYIVYVSVFGESEGVPYDYMPEATTFMVTGAPEQTSRGVIMSEHKWSFV